MKRFLVNLEQGLFDKLRKKAFSMNLSISALIRLIVTDYLHR
jgi:hypothetical protein